jgi:hypothetical protein
MSSVLGDDAYPLDDETAVVDPWLHQSHEVAI